MWKGQLHRLVWCAALIAVPCWAGEAKRAENTMGITRSDLRSLFEAIRHVETGSVAKPREALGDGGRSLGPYQISRAYWTDSGMNGAWRRCKNLREAELAMLAYWQRYCPEALRQKDFETLARVHNGGPTGHRKAATASYWARVRARL